MSPVLERYADELTERHPDVAGGEETDEEEAPWGDAPIKADIVGDMLHLALARP